MDHSGMAGMADERVGDGMASSHVPSPPIPVMTALSFLAFAAGLALGLYG
jgi:hypothetical protein